MGHGWARRLRSSAPALLPGHQRAADLLLCRQSRLAGERARKGQWSLAPFPSTLSLLLVAAHPLSWLSSPSQWVPEVRHFCPNVPFVLVGCKMDLRNDPVTIAELKKMKQKPVSYEEVRRRSKLFSFFLSFVDTVLISVLFFLSFAPTQ